MPFFFTFCHSFTGMLTKTVLCWKLVSVTMLPTWWLSTLIGNNLVTTTMWSSVSFYPWLEPHPDTAAVLHSGRRLNAARNSFLTSRPKTMLPPWSIQNPAGTSAVASSKAANRSDCFYGFIKQTNQYIHYVLHLARFFCLVRPSGTYLVIVAYREELGETDSDFR